MYTLEGFELSFECWGGIFSIITALCMFMSRRKEDKSQQAMILVLLFCAVMFISDVLNTSALHIPGSTGRAVAAISNFAFFVGMFTVTTLFSSYIWTRVEDKESIPKPMVLRANMIIYAIGILVVLITPFTGFVYTIGENAEYIRGSGHWTTSVIFGLLVISCIYLVITCRKRIPKSTLLMIVVYMLLGGSGFTFQLVTGLQNTGCTMLVIATTLVFFEQQIAVNKTFEYSEREASNARIDLMMSQIRPHFMFNTLTTIKHLCKRSPEQAAETIDNFALYLKHNLGSLNMTGTIPFSEEMEHVRSYLSIEQVRFGDRVKAEYDLQVSDFMVPVLSIQPVVENSVKHGVSKKIEGGTIRVTTCDAGECIKITVSDDGVGFDVNALPSAKDDTRAHVGIKNVINRLESMMDATVTINSTPGEGTSTEILLPKEKCALKSETA